MPFAEALPSAWAYSARDRGGEPAWRYNPYPDPDPNPSPSPNPNPNPNPNQASLKELQEARGGASYATRATRKQGKYTAAQQEAEAALSAATARLEAAAAQLAAVEIYGRYTGDIGEI